MCGEEESLPEKDTCRRNIFGPILGEYVGEKRRSPSFWGEGATCDWAGGVP